MKRKSGPEVGDAAAAVAESERQKVLLKNGALQKAISSSAHFSTIATDVDGVIQIFNVGAERMLGYTAAELMNQVGLEDLADPEERVLRAQALSEEFSTPVTPGFEALVFRPSAIRSVTSFTSSARTRASPPKSR